MRPFPFDKEDREVVFVIVLELEMSKIALAVDEVGWDWAGKLEDRRMVMMAGS